MSLDIAPQIPCLECTQSIKLEKITAFFGISDKKALRIPNYPESCGLYPLKESA